MIKKLCDLRDSDSGELTLDKLDHGSFRLDINDKLYLELTDQGEGYAQLKICTDEKFVIYAIDPKEFSTFEEDTVWTEEWLGQARISLNAEPKLGIIIEALERAKKTLQEEVENQLGRERRWSRGRSLDPTGALELMDSMFNLLIGERINTKQLLTEIFRLKAILITRQTLKSFQLEIESNEHKQIVRLLETLAEATRNRINFYIRTVGRFDQQYGIPTEIKELPRIEFQ